MPAKSLSQKSSSNEVLQTVAWLEKQGFKAVAIVPGTKAAVSKEYAQPGYTPPDRDWFRHNAYGVGVVTGPAAGGPIDVDLDCEEAIYFASSFLPPTPAIFGRASKPRSHYLYRIADPLQKKLTYNDTAGDKLVSILEIRADGGHQTVMPGTIHADGELIQWEGPLFPDVPVVDTELILDGAKMTAIAVLVSRHLWMEGQRNEVTKHLAGMFYYLGWTEEKTAALVSAVMSYSNDDDKTRAITVRNTYRKADQGGKITGASTLAKFLGNEAVVIKIRELAGNEAAGVIQEFNERFGQVMIAGSYRVVDLDVKPGQTYDFMSVDNFNLFTRSEKIEIDGKKLPKARIWGDSPKSLKFRGVEFLPGQDDTGSTLNLWTGWPLKPDRSASCSAWLELLREWVCGDDQTTYHWLLNWFANIIREPMERPLTSPVILSDRHGTGKTVLISYFGRILGSYYLPVTDENHLIGRFNAHMGTCLLLHSEEALYSGDKRHKGIYQSMITDEYRIFEKKGVDATRVANYLRLVLTSNEDKAAPVQSKDRRWCIINMHDRKAPQVLIDRVLEEMRGAGPAALLHLLQTMEYDGKVIRTILTGRDLAEAKDANATPLESWWLYKLRSGQLLDQDCFFWSKPPGEPWPMVVASRVLWEMFVHQARQEGHSGRTMTMAEFGQKLLKMLGGVKPKKETRRFDQVLCAEEARIFNKTLPNKQEAWLNFPDLETARAGWLKFRQLDPADIDWPAPMPDGDRLPHDKDRPGHERY